VSAALASENPVNSEDEGFRFDVSQPGVNGYIADDSDLPEIFFRPSAEGEENEDGNIGKR
jgi:hypothetical protein